MSSPTVAQTQAVEPDSIGEMGVQHSAHWPPSGTLAPVFHWSAVFRACDSAAKSRMIAIYATLAMINALAWGWALVAFHGRSALLGWALLAFGFGLRHAVDADHIAAIDNATRVLMHQRQSPVAVGLFFSLGHLTVVVLACFALALATHWLKTHLTAFELWGQVLGTALSALLLLTLAVMNCWVLRSIYLAWRGQHGSNSSAAPTQSELPAAGGLLAHCFGPLFALISRSWHVFPIGFVFGLGFDSALEVALLGLAVVEAANGLPPWTIMVFPLLFGAGMTLVDTLEGHLMLGAYGWALDKPARKLRYNACITLVSIIAAASIGGVQLLGLFAQYWALKGPLWDGVAAANSSMSWLGGLIIAIFALGWLASVLIWRSKRQKRTVATVGRDPTW